jgi:hypothetical protein
MRLTIDRVDAGTLRIRGPVENATLRLEEFSARGADVDLRGRGSIRFARNLRLSTVPELMLRIEVKEGYRNRSERAQAIFSLLESPSPLDPNTTIAGPFRASDGAYQVRLGGPLFRMTATPAGTASIR